MENPLSREEAALRVEARLAQLKALGLNGKVRNPHDRRPLSGEARIHAQIQGHQGIIADVSRSDAEVQTAIVSIQRLQSLIGNTVSVQPAAAEAETTP